MTKRACPRCGRSDTVRAERIFKGGVALTEFVCEPCGHTWTEHDGGSVKADAAPAS